MGQKAFKNSPYLTLEEFYPSSGAYESRFPHTSPPETLNAGPAFASDRQCPAQSACEFKDFCNHMYYVEDRCCCATVWKKMPGLVLPASA